VKIKSTLSRYRLVVNLLALAIALGALASSPPATHADDVICDEGCIEWNAQNGCTKMMSCCVRDPTDWTCVEWSPVR
jgi:hypothetical protein